jgi:hypothetical protein
MWWWLRCSLLGGVVVAEWARRRRPPRWRRRCRSRQDPASLVQPINQNVGWPNNVILIFFPLSTSSWAVGANLPCVIRTAVSNHTPPSPGGVKVAPEEG